MSITVSNPNETDMPGPVTLYYPNNKQIEEFGSPTLAAGASQNWTGTWAITQSQLEAGRLTFTVKYALYNADGELVSKTKKFSKVITYTGAVTSVEVNRTITPTTAREGQTVTVTYDIVNTGTVDITDVVIKEHKNISSSKGTIASIPAGEKGSYSFTTTMKTSDLTSEATITYKSGADSVTQTAKSAAQTIRYGEVKLTATLTSDKKGGRIGDPVTLTLTLKNTGNADYTDVTVSDQILGTLFTNQTVPAGQTLTLERVITLTDTQDCQLTVTGHDAAGNEVETATDRLTLTALNPSQVISLSVNAEPDRTVVYTNPGVVKFTISVTNESSSDTGKVTVSAAGTNLYTFDSIKAGQTAVFTRDVSISMNGTYAFKATCTDQLGQSLSFDSNSVYLSYSQPTPVPTKAPIVTPPAPNYEDIPTTDGLPAVLDTVQHSLGILFWVFGGIALFFAVLSAVGLIGHLTNMPHGDTLKSPTATRSYGRNVGRRRSYITGEDFGNLNNEETTPEENPEEVLDIPEEESEFVPAAAPVLEELKKPAEKSASLQELADVLSRMDRSELLRGANDAPVTAPEKPAVPDALIEPAEPTAPSVLDSEEASRRRRRR